MTMKRSRDDLLCSSTPKRSSKRLKEKTQPLSEILNNDHVYAEYIETNPIYADYLLNEWGYEKRSEHELFEHFTLSGQQVGLSWWTILSKREAYRQAFHCFDIDKVASMSTMDVDEIMSQESKDKTKLVVRNPCKLRSVIHNAKLIQTLKANGTISSFSEYLWSFVDDKPILNRLQQVSDMPIQSKESMRMYRALKKHGLKYVGPTTMYAMMQSCGLVMDYIVGSKHLAEAEKRLKNREGGISNPLQKN